MSSPSLPFDILCNIIDHCALRPDRRDSQTLQSLALLNSSCKTYSDKYIWKHISLIPRSTNKIYRVVSILKLRSRCEALIRNDRRASCVRTLEVVFKGWMGTDDEVVEEVEVEEYQIEVLVGEAIATWTRRRKDAIDTVARAIWACRAGLEELVVLGPYHMADLGMALRDLVLDSDGRLRVDYPLESEGVDHDHSAQISRSSNDRARRQDGRDASPPTTADSNGGLDQAHTTSPILFVNLCTFSSVLAPVGDNVLPFLAIACPNITAWKVSGRTAGRCLRDLPAHDAVIIPIQPPLPVPSEAMAVLPTKFKFLPRLHSFSGPATSLDFEALMRGRQIHTLDIINTITSGNIPWLLKGLRAAVAGGGVGGGGGVKDLSLSVSRDPEKAFGNAPPEVLREEDRLQSAGDPWHALLEQAGEEMDEVTRILHRIAWVVGLTLTSLTLFSHGQFSSNLVSEEEDMGMFLTALERFEKLEEFEWWDQKGYRWGDWLTERLNQTRLSAGRSPVTIRINSEAE